MTTLTIQGNDINFSKTTFSSSQELFLYLLNKFSNLEIKELNIISKNLNTF